MLASIDSISHIEELTSLPDAKGSHTQDYRSHCIEARQSCTTSSAEYKPWVPSPANMRSTKSQAHLQQHLRPREAARLQVLRQVEAHLPPPLLRRPRKYVNMTSPIAMTRELTMAYQKTARRRSRNECQGQRVRLRREGVLCEIKKEMFLSLSTRTRLLQRLRSPIFILLRTTDPTRSIFRTI